MKDKRNLGLFYASFTALLWGFLAIALKVALNILDPVSVVWIRFSVAFTGLLILTTLFDPGYLKVFKRPPWMLVFAAIFLGLNYLGFISGVHYTTPSSAQVFIQIGPVSLGLTGILFFKEKFTWKHVVGILMLIAGFILYYSQNTRGEFVQGEYFTRGMIFVLLGGLSWAIFSVFQKMLVKNYSPNHLNLFIYGFASLMFLPFADLQVLPTLNYKEWLLLIFLGLNTLLAYGSLALALKYAEANKISVIITMNPMITFLVMALLEVMQVVWIQYEHFTFWSLAGAGMVFGGAILVVTSGKGRGKNGSNSLENVS